MPRIIHLILDFDGTLTQTDTLAHLASAAYPAQNDQSNPDLMPWSHFVDAYMDDYNTHVAAYTPAAQNRTTVAQEAAWLESLRGIEEASMARVQQHGVFDMVTIGDIDAAARDAVSQGRVVFRPGWAELAAAGGATVDIVSVNWSRRWVCACMVYGLEACSAVNDGAPLGKQEFFDVYANEIGRFASVGEMRIQTSSDKVRYAMIRKEPAQPESVYSPGLIVYAGDSTTDLECLLAADVGICIRDEPMGSGQRQLAETFERLKIEVGDLAAFDEVDAYAVREAVQAHNSENTTYTDPHPMSLSRIWWVNNFHDVQDWLIKWRPKFETD